MWGTRGSLPRTIDNGTLLEIINDQIDVAVKAGISEISEFKKSLAEGKLRDPISFGGQTTCSEVIHNNNRFFVDMGTGLTDAAQQAMAEGRNEFIVFQTHMHWDHIMGMPFFIPIYIPGTKITIYHVHPTAPDYIKIQFNGINFPVKWDQLSAEIEFKQIKVYDEVQFDDVTISPFSLDHPGGSFGYRFDTKDQSLAIGVDGEYQRLSPKQLGKDLKYYQNLDLLVFDGQYEMDELASRFDWGHSSPAIGVDLALREGIKNIIITHHDPRSHDEKERRMLEAALHHKKLQLPAHQEIWNKLGQPQGPNVELAFDGKLVDLDKL